MSTVTRSSISQQLLRFANGIISAEELSAWAGEAILAKDQTVPPLPIGESDFLEEILTNCVLVQEPQFELSVESARDLMARLAAEKEPSDGLLAR